MGQHSMEIEGIEALMTKLAALGGDIPAAVHKGLMKGGKLVQRNAKMLCPVDSGRLRSSIAVTDEKEHKYTYKVKKKEFSGKISGGSQDTIAVGTNVEYAPYIEFGTGQRGDPSIAHSSDVMGQAPQPFLGPALALAEHRVHEEVVSAMRKAIREVAKGG